MTFKALLATKAGDAISDLPFILRNVTLAGIDSVNVPKAVRLESWRRLGVDLDFARLARTATTVRLADVAALAPKILKGEVQGRTVVDVNA